MAIETLVVHRRRVVSTPAPAFTARHQDRHTLSGRRLTRMPVDPVIAARRALTAAPAVVVQPSLPATEFEPDCHPAPRQWPWTLASLLLIVLAVAACARLAM